MTGTLDGRHARVEELSYLERGPAQHLAQDKGHPLVRRKMLEQGHEGQADTGLSGGLLRRTRVERQNPGIGDGGHPRAIGEQRGQGGGHRWPGRTELGGQGAAPAAAKALEADVGGDPVQPPPHARGPLGTFGGAPGPDQRLVDGLFCAEARPEQAIAVGGELATVGVDVRPPVMGRRSFPHGHHIGV